MHIYNPDDLFVIAGRSNMGIAFFREGHLEEAEHLHRYVFKERRRILGNNHHETIKSKANIAMTINEMGQHAQAVILYWEALRLFDAVVGPLHPDTLKTYTNLATALHDQGRYVQAEEAVVTVLPTIRSIYGPGHEKFLGVLEFHAILLHCLKLYAAALDVASQVYEQRLISFGYMHCDTQSTLAHMRDLIENCEEERSIAALNPLVAATAT
jgi:tetratricopeptide (TPR) repeat protein